MCIGYNPASVYVRRGSGKTDAVSGAEIIISAVGDQYAQEELDAENAEAERYPLGPRNSGVLGWWSTIPLPRGWPIWEVQKL